MKAGAAADADVVDESAQKKYFFVMNNSELEAKITEKENSSYSAIC